MKVKHFAILFIGIMLFIAGCAFAQNTEELESPSSETQTTKATEPTANVIITYPTDSQHQETLESNDDYDPYSDITFASGVYPIENWGRTQSIPYDGDAVPDGTTAVNVATQIFNSLPKSANEERYKPGLVFFDEQDKVWIVSFWEKESTTTLCGGLVIVIRQSDCAVLSIHRERQ